MSCNQNYYATCRLREVLLKCTQSIECPLPLGQFDRCQLCFKRMTNYLYVISNIAIALLMNQASFDSE